MGKFNNRDYGRRDFKRRDFGDRGDRRMFKAVCSNCGKDCEVPFQPTGDKPIYCDDCFRNKRGGDEPRRSSFRDRNSGGGGGQVQYKQDFIALNAKLDKILSLLNSKPEEKEEKVINLQKEAPEVKKEEVKPAKAAKKTAKKKTSKKDKK